VLAALLLLPQHFSESQQLGVQSQLQHSVDAPACLVLQLLQWIEIPRIDHQWLFADHVRADSKR
jgi:hypothetical protein